MPRRILPAALAACVASLLAAAPASAVPCNTCPPPEEPPNGAPRVELTSIAPNPAHRGQVVTFQASATDADGDAVTITWDLDNDGAYDDGTGASVSRSYSTVGDVTVKVRASDGSLPHTASGTLTIQNRTPSASFTRNPPSPLTQEEVTFTSTS